MDTQLQSCATASAPYSLAIQNVSFSGLTKNRGVALSFGSPPQNFALALWPYASFVNNTYLFNNDYTIDGTNCVSQSTTIQCNVQHGGTFNENISFTWSQAEPVYVAIESVKANTGDIFGTDTIHLGPSSNISHYPIGIVRNFLVDYDVLGVGSNSTFINALLTAGMIVSRTWSVFWGQTGTNQHMDGLLTFGGYDAAKTSGSNFTDNLSSPIASPPGISNSCGTGIQVDVADITLDFPNGTSSSIFDSSHGTSTYCIDPSLQFISISSSPLATVQKHLGRPIGGTSGLYAGSLVYHASNIFSGNLTVSLTSGFSVTIPNDQLVVPDVYVQNDGSLQESSNSSRVLRLFPYVDNLATNFPILGQLFLSSTYLHVNYETSQFTLWRANATTNTNPITINSTSPCSVTTDPSPNSTTTTAGTTSEPISTGGIVGAAIGGLAFLALVALGLIFFIRKRKRYAHTTIYTKEEFSDKSQPSEISTGEPAEIGEPLSHELGTRPTRFELGG